MANKITNIITDYAGLNYQENDSRDKRIAKHQVHDLLSQGGLQEETAHFNVEHKISHKKVTVTVTKTIDCFQRHTYLAWENGKNLGHMKLDIITLKGDQAGSMSHGWGSPVDSFSSPYWAHYAAQTDTKGTVVIDDLEAYGRDLYKGIGTGLFQIAVEVSQSKKCPYKISLDASSNSPGFYRKMHCEHNRSTFNEAIDQELQLAKRGNREPNTSHWTGYMYLKEDGQSYWKSAVEKRPLLKN